MSEFKNLTLDVADQIAVLAISRPAALNALNSETLDELNLGLTEREERDEPALAGASVRAFRKPDTQEIIPFQDVRKDLPEKEGKSIGR